MLNVSLPSIVKTISNSEVNIGLLTIYLAGVCLQSHTAASSSGLSPLCIRGGSSGFPRLTSQGNTLLRLQFLTS